MPSGFSKCRLRITWHNEVKDTGLGFEQGTAEHRSKLEPQSQADRLHKGDGKAKELMSSISLSVTQIIMKIREPSFTICVRTWKYRCWEEVARKSLKREFAVIRMKSTCIMFEKYSLLHFRVPGFLTKPISIWSAEDLR